MNKAYSRIVWENYPSTDTPLNESNLNKMDSALDIIDDRVVSMDTTKLDKTTAYTMVKSIAYDESTGIFTITYLNGSTSTLDTKLEKLAVNFTFDPETEKMIITLDDGTTQEVDLSALISKYNFTDSDTIGFTVAEDGNVVAIVKEGSIEGKHLEPNYLANVTTQANNASASASNAAVSEMNAAASAEAAEAAADRAASLSSVSIATTQTAGIVKPDGATITVDADGKISVGEEITGEINSVKDDLANYAKASDHKVKTYTALSQIGLVDGEETIETIATTLPVYSILQIALQSINTNLGIYPSYSNQLIVHKTWASRSHFEVHTTDGKVYEGHYNSGTWTGWDMTFSESNPPTASDVGAVAYSKNNVDLTALLKSGAHFEVVKITTTGLGTPYDESLSNVTSYNVISYASSANNGMQLAFPSGASNTTLFMRTYSGDIVGTWSTGFLPLTGGTLSGQNLDFNSGTGRIQMNVNALWLYTTHSADAFSTNKRYLGLYNANYRSGIAEALTLTDQVNGTSTMYKVFGEHNKPSGSYTGNGSATRREITTSGNSGKVLFITTTGYCLFVTKRGAFGFANNTGTTAYLKTFASDTIAYYGNNIVMYGADVYFNQSGNTYEYYEL